MMRCAFVFIGLLLATSAPAQTSRYVAATGTDAGDCTNPGSPCATITYAIGEADAGDTVEIADGEYTESFEIDKSLTLNGENEAGTIIQAHAQPGQATSRVVTIVGDVAVAIANVTVRHGVASGEVPDNYGGGIFNRDGSLELSGVTVIANTAGNGGGIGQFASFEEDAHAELTGVTLIGNSAGYGGGILISSSSATILNTTLMDNTATFIAGGMYNSDSSPTLANVVFDENEAGNFAGGLYNATFSSPTLVNVLLTGNTAGQRGGGLYNVNFSSPVLVNTTLSGNEASFADGGGIANALSSSSTLLNTIAWGNTAGGLGNDIYNDSDSSAELQYSLHGNGPDDVEEGGGVVAENSSTGNPLFADAGNGDFRLEEGSPAVNTGDPGMQPAPFPTGGSGGPVDLDGNPRFFNQVIDIGAYERQTLVDAIFRDRFEDNLLIPK